MARKEDVDIQRLPSHIAVIMDGNGRWAKQQGKQRAFGHESGVISVREITEAAAELGVKYLTLYAFSTENWNRPKEEIDALMGLLVQTIHKETPTLNKNGIKLATIGDIKSLPEDCYNELQEAIEETSKNDQMTLVLALSYSSKWEITNAIKNIIKDVDNKTIDPALINENLIDQYLNTANMPHPELLIRTSGEYRISNFLLWQIAYAELYFTPILWPDFRKEHLYDALVDYQNRERRFGKTSEQLTDLLK